METIIPGRENAMLDDVEVFKDFLVSGERVNGQRQLYVRRWSEMTALPITFEDSVYTAYTGSNPEFDTHILRLVYSSLKTPKTVVDYNMLTGERTIRKQDEILGDTTQTISKASGFGSRLVMVHRSPFLLSCQRGLRRTAKPPCTNTPTAHMATPWIPGFTRLGSAY